MKIRTTKLLIFFFPFFLFLFIPQNIFATPTLSNAPGTLDTVVGQTGVVTDANRDLTSSVALIVNLALGLVAVIFLILMVYAGMKWMLSRGEEEQVKKSRNTIIGATIGLVVIVAAWAISAFIQSSLIGN